MNTHHQKCSDALLLDDGWTIANAGTGKPIAFPVPGDVHSALLAEGAIPDPYWRDAETALDWVHEQEWIAENRFQVEGPLAGSYVLTLDSVDTHAIVTLNGIEIGRCESQFLRWDFDVTRALQPGENILRIRFLSNSAIARAAQEAFPFTVPYLSFNNRLPHYNFLRKAQCHAGWDWNIALSPLGLYGNIRLRRVEANRLDDVLVRQRHGDGAVTLEVELVFHAVSVAAVAGQLRIDGRDVRGEMTAFPGENRLRLSVEIPDPRLWWPVGHGPQEMYDLTVSLGTETRNLRIGLREIELRTDRDGIGQRFVIAVNGREIFMRGANWIPADALPARATPPAVRDLLRSAVEANMNMIRVWGGGQYEPDWFYEMCSDMGLLVWQDFMFACNLYPSSDRHWLDLVRREARQQIRRLSVHPCMALWCGDNELVGALNWYPESRANRDRYLAMYDRLNFALEEAVEDEAAGIPFWPSSPSTGRLNFGDAWHDDTSGDMHFWDVWHSAKDFEHYYTVRPRFCSEFGFQSFPSMRVIESFTEPGDRNVSSAVMAVHQRNEGGNSRIVETIARYFRFPDSFEDMVYLSQIGQALAMKTSIEFWRTSKPRCMGTLYWQLNDTWPVASWSSLDYGGGWKLCHYLARKFYAPVLVAAVPDPETGEIVLIAVNDTSEPVAISVNIQLADVAGKVVELDRVRLTCAPDRASEVLRIPRHALADGTFLHFSWEDEQGIHLGENDFLPQRPKEYDFGAPAISVERRNAPAGEEILLTSDRPVFYVSWDLGGDTIWSDNGFTLLPCRPKVLSVERKRTSHLPATGPELRYLKG